MRRERLLIKFSQENIYSSDIYAVYELGGGESPKLNWASRMWLSGYGNLLHSFDSPAVLPMVKAILLKVYRLLLSRKGDRLGRNGTFEDYSQLNDGWRIWGIFTSYVRNIIKNESEQPKGSNWIRTTNTGLPKEGNLHGNRTTVVFERKRVVVNGASTSRSYSTGRTTSEKLNVIGKLEDLYLRSEKFTNESVDRNLYKILTNVELLEIAYNRLRSKPGQMTPGIKPETLDGMSKEVLEDIVAKLKNESFQFSPGRRVQIPKPSGGTRPLTIAPPRDKLVQEAMRMILEAVFEPTFSKFSHGFRPGKSCHSALKAVRQDFQPAIWIIEGDISKCFDSIDHAKLMNIIEAKILDRKFTKLIWKSLKAGYFEFKTYSHNVAGTPQGSIISPLLANIFMSTLDKKVEELKEGFDKGKKSGVSAIAASYHSKISRAKKKGDLALVKKLSKEAKNFPATNFEDPKFKKLSYIRYADDWMIGIKGTFAEVQFILNEVKNCLNDMGLTLSDTKTKITNINSSNALFLGTNIKRASEYSFTRTRHNNILKRNAKNIRMEAPIDRILKKLEDAGFIRSNVPHPKTVWLPLEHRQILHLYNAVYRGYLNYYSFAHNYSRVVSRLGLVLKQSCAKLLAMKYSLGTMAKVHEKFGPSLSISHEQTPGKIKTYSFLAPSYKLTLKFLSKDTPVIKALYGSVSLASLDSLKCSICDSEYKVEMHHIRHMKDLNPGLGLVDRLMIRQKRKQIPLCRECHMSYHRESNKTLKDLRNE